MRTVAIASMKGGCGKSTLARHGSVILPRCALLDLDPQGTSRRWIERRRQAGLLGPALVEARADQLAKVTDQLDGEWFIIDTPPSHDDQMAIRSAASVADLVLIPVRPTPDDLDVLGATLDLLGGQRAAFVITMANPLTTLFKRTEAALKGVPGVELAPVTVTSRVGYPEAAEDGQAVTEHDPKGIAAEEMRQLWGWVESVLAAGT